MGALVLTACGGGRTVEGTVRNDYAESREGIGTQYVIEVTESGQSGFLGIGVRTEEFP